MIPHNDSNSDQHNKTNIRTLVENQNLFRQANFCAGTRFPMGAFVVESFHTQSTGMQACLRSQEQPECVALW